MYFKHLQCDTGYGICFCVIYWTVESVIDRLWRACVRDVWMNWIPRPTFKSMFGNLKLSDSVTALFSTLVSSSEVNSNHMANARSNISCFFIPNLFPCELGAFFERRGLWTGLSTIIWSRNFVCDWNCRMMITRYRPVCKFLCGLRYKCLWYYIMLKKISIYTTFYL